MQNKCVEGKTCSFLYFLSRLKAFCKVHNPIFYFLFLLILFMPVLNISLHCKCFFLPFTSSSKKKKEKKKADLNIKGSFKTIAFHTCF